jgi:hypothetical protein
MCEWDNTTRSQLWEQKLWTPSTSLEPWSKNVLRKSLVDPKKMLWPPIHIKLGMIKKNFKLCQKLELVLSTLAKRFLICRRPN